MSLTGISANRLELLALADALAREKAIEKEIVVQAIEEAIQKAARARYGAEHDITASIDVKTGELILKRRVTVVDDDADFSESETPDAYLRLSDAKRTDKQAVVGKVYEEVLPPFDFGRVQTQMARDRTAQSSISMPPSGRSAMICSRRWAPPISLRRTIS